MLVVFLQETSARKNLPDNIVMVAVVAAHGDEASTTHSVREENLGSGIDPNLGQKEKFWMKDLNRDDEVVTSA